MKRRAKMGILKPEERIIFAADFSNLADLENYMSNIKSYGIVIGAVKLGMEILTSSLLTGENAVQYIMEKTEYNIMLDLKYHDIPRTVAGAAKAVARYGKNRIFGFTVHCLNSKKGLAEVVAAIKEEFGDGPNAPLPIAVTLLTSQDEEDLKDLGIQGTAKEVVIRWAKLAYDAGIRTFVSSPNETAEILKIDSGLIVINPGIKFAESKTDDQKRINTPEGAMVNGASYVVMGTDLRNGDPVFNISRATDEIRIGLIKRKKL